MKRFIVLAGVSIVCFLGFSSFKRSNIPVGAQSGWTTVNVTLLPNVTDYPIDISNVTGGEWTPKHETIQLKTTGLSVLIQPSIDQTTVTATSMKLYIGGTVTVATPMKFDIQLSPQ